MLGQVVVGILLGPSLANVVPHPAAWQLLGRLGLYCAVVESSMGVEFKKLASVALRAFVAAFIGLLGPIGFAFLVQYVLRSLVVRE